MESTVDQIADRIYRISTCIPDVAPGGFTFNQFVYEQQFGRSPGEAPARSLPAHATPVG